MLRGHAHSGGGRIDVATAESTDAHGMRQAHAGQDAVALVITHL